MSHPEPSDIVSDLRKLVFIRISERCIGHIGSLNPVVPIEGRPGLSKVEGKSISVGCTSSDIGTRIRYCE